MRASSIQTSLMWACLEGSWPMPVSLPVRIRSSTRGVCAVPGVQERELPAGGVDGECLIAGAVADLEGVQGRTGVRVLTADDDPHPRAGRGPPAQVEHAGHLHDVGVLTQPTVGVVRCGPGVLGDSLDGVPDRFGDGVADREPQSLNGKRGDQGVGVAGAVSPDEDLLAAPAVRDLRQGVLQHGQVVARGVATGVPWPQQHRQRLVGVVEPGTEWVVSVPALEVAFGVLLVRMGGDQGRVEVDHDVADDLAGCPRTG